MPLPAGAGAGKLEAFAAHAKIVHIDIDPAEIHKNKEAWIPIFADVKPALQILNRLLEQQPLPPNAFEPWLQQINAMREEFPMTYPATDDAIVPQVRCAAAAAVLLR